jgi:hypothetical protein
MHLGAVHLDDELVEIAGVDNLDDLGDFLVGQRHGASLLVMASQPCRS